MKHAKNILAGDIKIGDEFLYGTGRYNDQGKYEECNKIAKVLDVRKTKTGRLKFVIQGENGNLITWSHGAIVPHRMMQDS